MDGGNENLTYSQFLSKAISLPARHWAGQK